MISRPDFLSFLSMSTGMPRPLSATVTDCPSLCSVTVTSEAWPFMASSTELSKTSQTRWCSPAASDAADVHARALADGLQAFEDGEVFG